MGPHFVYWWYVRSHEQIKVGYGYDPRSRMTDYAKDYGFEPEEASLCVQEMRSERAAKYVERKLHEALRQHGLKDLGWEKKTGPGESRELFDIGDHTWESVSRLVQQLFDRIKETMPTDKQLLAEEMAENARRYEEIKQRRNSDIDDEIPF